MYISKKLWIISTECGYNHKMWIISTECGHFHKMRMISTTRKKWLNVTHTLYFLHGTHYCRTPNSRSRRVLPTMYTSNTINTGTISCSSSSIGGHHINPVHSASTARKIQTVYLGKNQYPISIIR